MPSSQRRQGRAQALLARDEQIGGIPQLQRGGGVPHVVGGEADMHEAGVGAELFFQAREQRDHLVLDAPLDGEDPIDIDPRVADAGQRLGRDASAASVGLAHRHFHPEPRLVLCGLAPDASHRGPGVPLDHAHTLMQNRTEWKATPHPPTTGRGVERRLGRRHEPTPNVFELCVSESSGGGIRGERRSLPPNYLNSAGRLRRSSGPSVVSASWASSMTWLTRAWTSS
jgi:hypothetical protein